MALVGIGAYTETRPDLAVHRILSRQFGWLASRELPESWRSPIFSAFASFYGVNLREMQGSLKDYRSFSEFFTRKLKKNARVIDLAAPIVSPVDGTVLTFGQVDSANGRLNQIKGKEYSLQKFMGGIDSKLAGFHEDQPTYYCIIYLAPKDYHRIHSPVDWTLLERKHFPGLLWSVAPVVLRYFNDIFAENERVVLNGEWAHGFFSMVPVGANNVGSITLRNEPEFHTNLSKREQEKQSGNMLENPYDAHQHFYHKKYSLLEQVSLTKGEEVATFNAGSTVVLIFQSEIPFQFDLNESQ
eukprot:CAMPEP_0201550088 /NCGR_PEP_ID=MMETSP0173_2-20130828/6493_1 /ASSEMBLY_ACC=CAM_ASM_000268 /TAXON_ID=218659 /ORGANISM="Vexillifera sp., Strain DIVA3 564/2" /LENGTH=298 /DNA_ID=CAMNT_0047959969 /DNA_START=672 /DNA_END=1565 /DNA_ORIENTATION=-